MELFRWLIIATVINYFVITIIVDIILLGRFSLCFSRKCSVPQFMVSKENKIDIQNGYKCSGYATAYLLRHYDIQASGEEVYREMPNKMANGYVYPKGIRKLLLSYGFSVKYCVGNFNALKREVSKGNPVIVLIRVRTDRNWLHYVPVVGYDEENVFIAESLEELVNCEEKNYNRKISNKEFLELWDTSMMKMPLYTNTFYVVEKSKSFADKEGGSTE